jgi:hypothetical protein
MRMWGCGGSPIFGDWLEEREVEMNSESCSKRDTCSKIERARLNRVCLCCSGMEPMESICARCEEKEKTGEGKPVLAA